MERLELAFIVEGMLIGTIFWNFLAVSITRNLKPTMGVIITIYMYKNVPGRFICNYLHQETIQICSNVTMDKPTSVPLFNGTLSESHYVPKYPNLADIMLCRRNRHRRVHVVWLHLCGYQKKAKPIYGIVVRKVLPLGKYVLIRRNLSLKFRLVGNLVSC